MTTIMDPLEETRIFSMLLSVLAISVCAGCNQQPAGKTSGPIVFHDLKLRTGSGVSASLQKSGRVLVLSSKALPQSSVKISQIAVPNGIKDPVKAGQHLFLTYKTSFAKQLPGGKFLGPPGDFHANGLTFSGGGWRSPDHMMSSLLVTVVNGSAYVIESHLESVQSRTTLTKDRKELQDAVGSISK